MAMTKDELRAAIRRNGLTVQEFADEFGITIDTLYRWGGAVGVPRWACRVLALMDQHGPAHVLGLRVARAAEQAPPESAPVVALRGAAPVRSRAEEDGRAPDLGGRGSRAAVAS